MRVVFLDIDGVLNSNEFLSDRKARGLDDLPQNFEQRSPEHWSLMLDPAAVARLNAIIDQTGAVVVISSSWRCVVRPMMIWEALRLRGFTGEVIDRTPKQSEMKSALASLGWIAVDHNGERGREIEVWLGGHRHQHRGAVVDRFVILDDAGPSAFGHMDRYLVQTTWARGLEDRHVADAVRMLTVGP